MRRVWTFIAVCLLGALTLTGCTNTHDMPTLLPTSIPASVEGSDSWSVEGYLPDFGAGESSTDIILPLRLRLLHADTQKPITSPCKLWPMSYPADINEGGAFSHMYQLGTWLVPRTGHASAKGDIEVLASFNAENKYAEFTGVEIPMPVGYQLAEKLSTSLAFVSCFNRTAPLYFRERPQLNVYVETPDGQPVWDAQVYAVPVDPAAPMRCWARWRSSVYNTNDPATQKLCRDMFNKDVEEYFDNDFHIDTIDGFRWNYHPSLATQSFYPMLDVAMTGKGGRGVVPNLWSGEWEVGVFVSGRGDHQRRRVKLGSEPHEIKFVAESVPLARVNIEVHIPSDRGWNTYYADIRRLFDDRRLSGAGHYWPDWYKLHGGDVAHYSFRFQNESEWMFRAEGQMIRFKPKFGETQNFCIDYGNPDTPTMAKLTPKIYLGDQPYTGKLWAYDELGETHELAHDIATDLAVGSYEVYLAGGKIKQFLLDAESRVRIDIEPATLHVAVGDWMFEHLHGDVFELSNDSRWWTFIEECTHENGQYTFTQELMPGQHKYTLGGFRGYFQVGAGKSVTLEFTKAHCTGLARLVVNDTTEDNDLVPSILGRMEPEADEDQYLIQPRGDGVWHVSTATESIYRDGNQSFIFGAAGPCFLDVNGIAVPASLPSEVTFGDEMHETQSKFMGRVELELPEWSENEWHPDLQYHCIHESGAQHVFAPIDTILPFGDYTLYVFEDMGSLTDLETPPRYAEIKFTASEDMLVLKWEDIDWQPMQLVEFELRGIGKDLDGGLGMWWDWHVDFRLECPDRRWVTAIEFVDAISLDPPLLTAKHWLPAGSYRFIRRLGSHQDFEVQASQKNKIIITLN
ncbi:hypothetical protein OAU50_04610 [Planctomycetota bacterium]|nr:hypothetical protein [Planctomycetota bacterium]